MTTERNISAYHWMLFAICFLGTAFAGTVSTLMSVYLPVAVTDLLGNQNDERMNTISAYINSVFIIGGAAGGFICGFISDKWGRKAGVIISILSYGVFTILTGLMPNWWGVVVCRFFSGFGLGGVLVTTVTLMMEVWPEKTRAIFIGILSISIPVGIFSAGVIDYFVSSWREGFAIGIFPVVLALISIRILKESPKWLAEKDKISLITSINTSVFSKSHRRELIFGSVIFGSMLIGLWAIFSWLPTWIQSLITEGDAQKERGISMMILGMGGLIGGFISGWLINALGTKKTMLICFAVCSVISLILFKTNTEFHSIIFAEIFVLSLFFGISQGVLSVYIPALFPVSLRGTATGFCFNTGRILTALAVLFVGVLVNSLGGYGNALFIFSAVFWIGFIVMFWSKSIHSGNGNVEDEINTLELSPSQILPQKMVKNMAHINVAEGIPGIKSLALFRPETGKPLYALVQVLLREPSPLTIAERELIAAYVSHRNNCMFRFQSHAAAAKCLYGPADFIVDEVINDLPAAAVSNKFKALLHIAGKVQIIGSEVKPEDINAAKKEGASDREIHDTVLIASVFSMFNRYVDGLASFTPTDPAIYAEMGKHMVKGYVLKSS